MARSIRPVTPPRGKIVLVDGNPARIVEIPRPEAEGGNYQTPRFCAMPGMSLKAARAEGLDFYHPRFGWLRGGYKLEVERPLTPAETKGLSDTVSDDYDLDDLEEFSGFDVSAPQAVS